MSNIENNANETDAKSVYAFDFGFQPQETIKLLLL